MILALLRKELVVTWGSPVPYVTAAVFHVAFGLLVVDQIEVRGQAVLQPMFPVAGFLLVLAVPVLTMRLVAEEARTGTLDLLLTAPVPPGALIVAKFLAAWSVAAVLLLPTGAVVMVLDQWGTPDLGPAISGGVGLLLLAAALTGIGILSSACTSSQAVAAMVAIFAALVLWFAHSGPSALRSGGALASVSLSERLRPFAGGAIAVADVGYFASLTLGSLALAALAVELRRFR